MPTRYTHRSPDLIAKGFYVDRRSNRERKRANLYMDGTLFERIRSIAIEDQVSLSTLLRELVVDGLAARDIARSRA